MLYNFTISYLCKEQISSHHTHSLLTFPSDCVMLFMLGGLWAAHFLPQNACPQCGGLRASRPTETTKTPSPSGSGVECVLWCASLYRYRTNCPPALPPNKKLPTFLKVRSRACPVVCVAVQVQNELSAGTAANKKLPTFLKVRSRESPMVYVAVQVQNELSAGTAGMK